VTLTVERRTVVRFGVNLPNFGEFGDPNDLVAIAVDAEQAGWDGFFIWDHVKLFRDQSPKVVDPWVAMAAVAQATDRITIGPMVTPPPRRRPIKLAREAVTLDHLSRGRLVLGVGIGWPPDVEFGDFGDEVDNRVRADMLEESLAIQTGLWTGEPFAYEGEHYRLAEMTFQPPPVQQPRIPIWVGAFWPNRRPMRRAARWDGLYAIPTVDNDPVRPTTETFGEIVDFVRAERAANGKADEPFDIVASELAGHASAERIAEYAALGATWWMEGLGWPQRTFAEWREFVQAGPPKVAP
jgi:alkanesulfonate monooxygenase SsuD/methylene tetrahydromethanopterin reductase-like flavin-dependent oxidoreductase (luciferase family)